MGTPPAAPAPSASTLLARSKLLDDLAILRDAYATLHPGLYRYRSPAEIDAAFAAAEAEFSHDRTLGEAFLVFSRLAAEFRCGHSFCNPANQGKTVRAAVIEAGARVPFLFRWLDGRMIATEALRAGGGNAPALAPGDEVVAINGIETAGLLAAMMPLARADGANDAKRLAYLELRGNYAHEAFDILLPLLHPELRDAATFLLSVRGLDGLERTVAGPAHTHADRAALAQARAGDTRGDTPLWTLTRPRPDAALLTMPTWAMYNTKWDWRAYLRGVFDGLAREGTANLVIDLRANEGGNDVGHEILARLTDRPIPVSTRQQVIAADRVPARLNPHLDTWDDSFRDRSKQSRPLGNGLHELLSDEEGSAGAIDPAGPRYTGRVFVLISPECSSATFEFAQLVRRTGLATLVGMPTGGNQRGITGGNFFFLRLPNTRIETDLPLKTTPLDATLPDAGIEPDIHVATSRADIAAGRDTELEAVYAAIDRDRK